MEEVSNCPLCGNSYFEKLYNKSFTYPGDDVESHLLDTGYVRRWILFKHILKKQDSSVEFFFIICKNCGFIFLSPRLNEKDIEIKYSLINKLGSVKARIAANPPENLDKRTTLIYNLIAKNQKNKLANLKILDFGGASGYNLKLFAKNNVCYVVDYEKWDLPKGVNYLCQTSDEIPHDMKFDVILCCHILEHLVDPVKTVNTLKEHLVSGGFLYVEVPLECFYDTFKQLRDPLTHINFYSNASLSYLLLDCGFNIRAINGGLYWLFNLRSRQLSMIGEKDGTIVQRYNNGHGYKSTLRQLKGPLAYVLSAYDIMMSLKRRIKSKQNLWSR